MACAEVAENVSVGGPKPKKLCPVQCVQKCNKKHHEILVALVNCDKDSEDLSALEEIINRYVPVEFEIDKAIPDAFEAYRLPMMHWAAALGLLPVIRWLLSKGASSTPGYPSQHLATPLHRALFELQMHRKEDPEDAFKQMLPLLWEGIAGRNEEGNTVLHLAGYMVSNGMPSVSFYTVCFKYMIEYANSIVSDGSIVNNLCSMLNVQGDTPLHLLAGTSSFGYLTKKSQSDEILDLIVTLVRMGVSFLQPNLEGNGPFECMKMRPQDVRLWMEHCKASKYNEELRNPAVDIDAIAGDPILKSLFLEDAHHIVPFLISRDSEALNTLIGVYDNLKMPFVHWAAATGSYKNLCWLKQLIKNPNFNPPTVVESPLHIALILFPRLVSKSNMTKSMKKIIPFFTNCVSAVDELGDTPLHKCAQYLADAALSESTHEFYVASFGFLLDVASKQGVEVSKLKNLQNNTVLHYLVQSKRIPQSLVKRVISSSSDLMQPNSDGLTPYMVNHTTYDLEELVTELALKDGSQDESAEDGMVIAEDTLPEVQEEDPMDTEGDDPSIKMEEELEDEEDANPVITIEKDGKMIDLVGEDQIMLFLSTLKAPSVTLNNFYEHITNMRQQLDAELKANEQETTATRDILADHYSKVEDAETRIKSLSKTRSDLAREEKFLLNQVEFIEKQISGCETTLDGLNDTLSHCKGALNVLRTELVVLYRNPSKPAKESQ